MEQQISTESVPGHVDLAQVGCDVVTKHAANFATASRRGIPPAPGSLAAETIDHQVETHSHVPPHIVARFQRVAENPTGGADVPRRVPAPVLRSRRM
jgi:hypothetical protein